MDSRQQISTQPATDTATQPLSQLRFVALLTLSLFSGFALGHNGHENNPHPFVVSGVIVNSDGAERVENFVKVLSKAANYSLKVTHVDSYRDLSEALRTDPNAIGWTSAAPFVEDRRRDGQQLVSVPLFRGQPTYSSLIITRRGRAEKSLLAFKGQVFAYSDPRSNSGYVAPAYQLAKTGIEIHNFFRLMIHAGIHERSIEAVTNGLADVAAVDEYIWVEYLKLHPEIASTVYEIERFGPFPFTPIVAGRAVSPEAIARLQRALLSFSQQSDNARLLQAFGLDGFVTKQASFFDPIAKMMDSLSKIQKDTP
jgi:phosphate/phosphite/phosphonate ABC transporter binding protein